MFTRPAATSRRASRADYEQAAAAAEYLVWSDRSGHARGARPRVIDEACWLDLVGEAQMITYKKY